MVECDNTSIKNLSIIPLMGGTFNPIHMGHLACAEAVRCKFGFEKIVFMPSGTPPHKPPTVLEAEHRYEMTRLAIMDNPNFIISDLEINRTGNTFTIDTIKEIKKIAADSEIYFITGADTVFEIETWKDVDELFTLCHFIAITRPGYDKSALEKETEILMRKYCSAIQLMEVPSLDISSSNIRSKIQEGQSIKYLVPEPVYDYINEHGLYQ